MKNSYSEQIARLRNEIETADAIVVGAGAGLSTSAGFTYSGERFRTYFSDFEETYGFHDMYSGGFYVMRLEPEISWAYWARNIYINRYVAAPMTMGNKKAVYACVNYGEAMCPKEIENRSICIEEDIGAVLLEMIGF